MKVLRFGLILLSLIPIPIHAATRTWTGTTSGQWSVASNWGGTAPVAGDDLVFPTGALNTNNSNDFPSGTAFHSIAISGAGYSLSGNSLDLAGGLIASANASISLPIRLTTAQRWAAYNGTLTINSNLSGTGGLNLDGSFTFTGTNTFAGQLVGGYGDHILIDGGSIASDVLMPGNNIVWGGVLEVRNGANLAGSVTVTSGDFTVGPGGGTVGNLTLQKAPGCCPDPPNSGFTTASDRTLLVGGTVNISSTFLYLSVTAGDTPAGTQFVLVDNAGSQACQCGFVFCCPNPIAPPFTQEHYNAGSVVEGYVFQSGQTAYSFSYHGGTGNDITLTSLGPVTPTTTTVTTAPNPSIAGQPVTIVITVTSASGTPSGKVLLYDGTLRIGPDGAWTPYADIVLNASGVATYTAWLAQGTHSITAKYDGSGTIYATSTSAPVVQVVNPPPTSTAVISSLNPVQPGQSVTFTATVAGSGGTPTGSVTFFDGTTQLATVALVSGVATFSTSSLSVGTHTITAVYTGGGAFAGSTSPPLAQVVSQCAYDVQPSNVSFLANGGSRSIVIDTPPSCAWTAVSNANWINLTGPVSGSGNGVVRYSVEPAPTLSSRTATISIAGHDVTITQDGKPCSFTLSAFPISFPREGGEGSISVTAPNGCIWNVATADEWITIVDGQSGAGSGVTQYVIASNGGNARVGSILIGGQAVKIDQDGCSVATPVNLAPDASKQVTSPVTLMWSTLAGVTAYHVCVTDSRGTDVVEADTGASSLTVSLDPGMYSWFVSALFGDCPATSSTSTNLLVIPARKHAAPH